MIVLLQPAATSFYIGTLRLTLYRLILLATVIPLLLKLFSRRLGRLRPADWLLIVHSIWVCIALGVVHDIETALKTGGVYFVESVGAYMLGRAYIRDPKSFKSVAILYFLIVAMLTFETVPEAITGTHFLRPGEGNVGRRMGLERAFGPFDHPIILGVYCATSLGLTWYVLGGNARLTARQLLQTFVVMVSAIMSVSSGAVATLVTQIMFIGWDTITRGRRRRWQMLLALFVAAYIFVALFSNRTPMTVALYYLTFNAETAYGRITIWDNGILEVGRHPFFGIGNNSWQHPTWISDSIDNFWLATAMLYGLPAFFTLTGSIIYVFVSLMRRKLNNTALINARMGWIISMTGLILAACTVFLWNAIFVLLFFLLGCGVWLLDAQDIPPPQQKIRRKIASLPSSLRPITP